MCHEVTWGEAARQTHAAGFYLREAPTHHTSRVSSAGRQSSGRTNRQRGRQLAVRRGMSLYVVARPSLANRESAAAIQSLLPLDRPAAETCESLFLALDGRDLVVLGRRWRMSVFSVVELAGRRYVQLSLEGAAQYMLTARLTPATRSRQVIPAVLDWLRRPTGSGEVVDVN